jgi:hypothetical protein
LQNNFVANEGIRGSTIVVREAIFFQALAELISEGYCFDPMLQAIKHNSQRIMRKMYQLLKIIEALQSIELHYVEEVTAHMELRRP